MVFLEKDGMNGKRTSFRSALNDEGLHDEHTKRRRYTLQSVCLFRKSALEIMLEANRAYTLHYCKLILIYLILI